MIVKEIDRRGGECNVRLVDYKTGEVIASSAMVRAASSPQMSRSNGIVGTKYTLKKAQKLDAELGVADAVRYVKTHETLNRRGHCVAAYAAEFASRADKNRWLRAHKRVDLDAGYGDPSPGTFRDRMPHEFGERDG